MADTKISDLTAATSALGSDQVHVNESGVSKSLTVDKIKAYVVGFPTLGDTSVDTHIDYLDSVGSAGFFAGGIITKNVTPGQIDVSAGSGIIRATSNATAPLISFAWEASGGIVIPYETTQWVYIGYNGGSPLISISTDEFLEAPDKILIGMAIAKTGEGIELKANMGVRLAESIGQAGRVLRRCQYIQRDKRFGGLTISSPATRKFKCTAGQLWLGRTQYPIAGIDTSITGTFEAYYRNGSGGFSEDVSLTQWPNTKYDNGTGILATLAAGKWGILWVYVDIDGGHFLVYGQDSYNTQPAAEASLAPTIIDDHAKNGSILLGTIIFQESSDIGHVDSAFNIYIPHGGVTRHADLDGLSGTDHPSTALSMSATDKLVGRSSAGAGASEEIPCTAAGRSIIATSDAGLVRVKALASNLVLAGSTAEKVTGLDVVVGAGTWAFEYRVLYRSSVSTNGIKCSVNHNGTITTFVANMTWICDVANNSTINAKQNSTGTVVSPASFSARNKSTAGWGPTGSVDTVDVDLLMTISGLMVVTVSGNIELWAGSEVNNPNVSVMANSSLILTKVA